MSAETAFRCAEAGQRLVPNLADGALRPFGQLTSRQFELIRDYARRCAGIAIADCKRMMVRRRLSKRVTALGMASFDAYFAYLDGPGFERERQPLINALTTNKTSFFREDHHFEHLSLETLPALLKRKAAQGSRRLRIWSAGCSSGEEPYSIAMILSNAVPYINNWDARILATDIDTDILNRARKAQYPAEDGDAVPSGLRNQFMTAVPGSEGYVQVAAPIRNLVVFKALNLHDPWPMKGKFDVIFCRNVVIYFDKPTQRKLFGRFADALEDDGILYCGHSESLFGLSTHFKPIGRSIYARSG